MLNTVKTKFLNTQKCSQVFVATLCLGFLSGCSVFSQDAEESRTPAELKKITQSLDVQTVWKSSIGDEAEGLGYGLQVAVRDEVVYLASSNGVVRALDANNGKAIWATQTGVVLSAGPSVGAGRVVVGGNNGDVIALEASDGKEIWRTKVDGEVITAPGVGTDQVAVRSANGTLHVLGATTGARLWFDSQEVPTLSLRGSSTPIVTSGVVIVGTDAGKVISYNALDGAVLWERLLGLPRGTTEIERLIDIDGPIALSETFIYAIGFNSRISKIDARSGTVIWSKEHSSNNGVSLGAENGFISNADDHVIAVKQDSGTESWKNKEYEYRELSTPVAAGSAVVVGDFEGYVHFLSPQDGSTIARSKVSKSAIKRSPLAANDLALHSLNSQ